MSVLGSKGIEPIFSPLITHPSGMWMWLQVVKASKAEHETTDKVHLFGNLGGKVVGL